MNYNISIGYKLPIPGINYSSYEIKISSEGEDYEFLKKDLFQKLEDLNSELLSQWEVEN